jgi:hypothetical protein
VQNGWAVVVVDSFLTGDKTNLPLSSGKGALAKDLAPEHELQGAGMQCRVASLCRTPRAGGLLRSGPESDHFPVLPAKAPRSAIVTIARK